MAATSSAISNKTALFSVGDNPMKGGSLSFMLDAFVSSESSVFFSRCTESGANTLSTPLQPALGSSLGVCLSRSEKANVLCIAAEKYQSVYEPLGSCWWVDRFAVPRQGVGDRNAMLQPRVLHRGRGLNTDKAVGRNG